MSRNFTSRSWGRIDLFNTQAHNSDGTTTSITADLDLTAVNDQSLEGHPVIGGITPPM